MGYYNRAGVVGTYQGQDVYVISYEKLTKDMSLDNPKMLYAVRRKDRLLDIVENGYWIGTMTDDGSVSIDYKKSRPFSFYEKKEEALTEGNEVKDYSHYAKVVNEFFEGLEKLWQEIDQSFVE